MSGSTDAGRLLVRIEATTAQLRQELQKAQQAVGEASGKIDSTLKQADKAFDRLNAASKEAQNAVAGLSSKLGPLGGALNALGPAGIAAGAGMAAIGAGMIAVAKAGDQATATLAKLTSATGGTAAAQAAYEGLFRLSQQTGASVADSAAAFARFAVAAKEVGATNDQVLRLVSGLQKAGIVAGSSAEEAKAGAQQLAQALASGVLQGDELRSVLENMPQLAQALAREFGTSIGGLRKMGEEGKLTADLVLPKLLKAAEDIGKEFDKQPATMSRASDILKNATIDLGERLDKIAGLSQAFAKYMLQGAAALRGMGAYVAPNDREANQQAISAGESRASTLSAEIERLQGVMQGRGVVGTAVAGVFGVDTNARIDKLKADLATTRDQLSQHYNIRFKMQLDADTREQNEQQEAAQRAADAARQRGTAMLAEFDKSVKTVASINEKYRKENEKLDAIAKTGAATAAQIAERRAALTRQQKEELESLAKAETKGGEEAKKAAEKRDKAVQTLEEQVAAAERAKAATLGGEGASKAMALALDVENKIREAGIPITGKRTEAEEKAAESIEKNVRKLDELKESTKQLEEAQKKAADAQKKFVDASRTALTDIPAKALDRLGDSLVDAFVRGEGAAINFGNIARGVIASAVADLAKLAVINPLMNSLFVSSSGARPTLAGASGGSPTTVGFGDLLGLGSVFGGSGSGGIGGALGLTGSGGLLSTQITAPMGGYSATASGGVVAPAGTTIGGFLGAAGLGFGAGSLLNNVLGRTGAQATNGMIGSGVGGIAGAAAALIPALSAIPGIGPILGIAGGLLGGGLGGLIGPGESVKGYGYQLRPNAQGQLEMGPSFYNATGQAAFQEASSGISNVNAYLSARGLTVGGAAIVGGDKNGADYSNATAGSFGEAVSQLYYHSSNAQLENALSQRGNQFGSADAMQQFVDGFFAIQDVITGLTAKPIPAFEQQLKAVNDNFDAAAAKAREYSLAEDELNAARAESIATLEKQRTETLRQTDTALAIRLMTAQGDAQGAALAQQAEAARQEINSLTAAMDALALSAEDKADRLVRLEEVQNAERAAIVARFGEQANTALTTTLNSAVTGANSLLRELTYGGSSALAPSQKYFAAISDLSAAKQALDSGGDLSAYTAVAQAVLPVARDFLGTSSRYGQLAAEVGSVISSKGGDANLAGILSANVDATVGGNQVLATLLSASNSELVGLRREVARLASTLEAMLRRQSAVA